MSESGFMMLLGLILMFVGVTLISYSFLELRARAAARRESEG